MASGKIEFFAQKPKLQEVASPGGLPPTGIFFPHQLDEPYKHREDQYHPATDFFVQRLSNVVGCLLCGCLRRTPERVFWDPFITSSTGLSPSSAAALRNRSS